MNETEIKYRILELAFQTAKFKAVEEVNSIYKQYYKLVFDSDCSVYKTDTGQIFEGITTTV